MRLYAISVLGLFSVVGCYAGAIQIGGSSGLSSNYITQGLGAVCAAGAGNCVAGSTTGYVERNYNNILFSGATNTGGTVTPTPFPGYQQSGGEPSGLTATDGTGTTFAMLSDGAAAAGNASNNYWGSTAVGGNSASITIPIGIFGVTDLWTMLDNQWGTIGGNDTTVTFKFGSSSNDTSGDVTSVAVALTNSNNVIGAGATGEMRAALACGTITTATCNAATNPHGLLQQGAVINGVTVNTGVVYNTFTYTAANPAGFYANTSGKLKLDDQQFVFGSAYLNDWLVSVTVTENDGNTPASIAALGASGVLPSETTVSAITVDTVPEPTTVLLLLSGLGGIGFLRFRRT